MTYCGLTNMGIAYKPEIDGETLDLGAMTQLKNNLVPWDQKSGEPIVAYHKDLDSVGVYYNDTCELITSLEFGGDGDQGQLPRVETMKA